MKPKHLSDLGDYRKRLAMTELLRREVLAKRRVRVKAVGRHVAAKPEPR
jgi:hypothetical protein